MITTKEFQTAPIKVEAVQVNKKNAKSVAQWSGGSLVTEARTSGGNDWWIEQPVGSRKLIIVTGWWVYRVEGTKGFKVMSSAEFKRKFTSV